MIFGYPPIIYEETDHSTNKTPKKVLEEHIRYLWSRLGKHVYGDESQETQLKIMLERHDELENQEKYVEKMFAFGRKLDLAKVINTQI